MSPKDAASPPPTQLTHDPPLHPPPELPQRRCWRGLEFWCVTLRQRIPLVLFRSKSIAVDRGRADNSLKIH